MDENRLMILPSKYICSDVHGQCNLLLDICKQEKTKNVQFRFSAKKCYLIVQSKTLTWLREGYSHGKNVDQKVKNSEQSITLYFSVLQAVCYNFFVCLRWKSKRENIRFSKWTSYRAVAGLVLRQFYENTTTNTWPFEIKRPSNY